MNRKTTHVDVEKHYFDNQYIRKVKDHPQKPKKYFIITYGCQMNSRDSETIAGLFEKMRIEKADTLKSADIILYNTCSIRENAQRRALGNIIWIKTLKESKPNLLLCVCGCLVQQPDMADEIMQKYPFIDIAFGTHMLYKLPELLYNRLASEKQMLDVSGEDLNIVPENMPAKYESPYSAFVNIMFGCNNFCTYCIVPYVRGRERSRRPDNIINEINGLIDKGYKEITLLGQNVNSYSSGDVSFPDLLNKIALTGIERIRFMTSHPKDLSDELIKIMARHKNIAKHIHLPVQSGSDDILSRMNRKYNVEKYLNRIQALRAAMPDIAITTDFIVGFPGESDEDHAKSLELIKNVGYDSIYAFVYSRRNKTKAAEFSNQIPDDVSNARIREMLALQEEISGGILTGLIGSRQTVLIQQLAKRSPHQVTGKCERNISVNLDGDKCDFGKMLDVIITHAGHNTLKGRRA